MSEIGKRYKTTRSAASGSTTLTEASAIATVPESVLTDLTCGGYQSSHGGGRVFPHNSMREGVGGTPPHLEEEKTS